MTKIVWKPGTMLAPVPPALISCGTIDNPNMMTAAWTGIIASDPAMTYVSIRPSRYSHEIISKNKEFVINLTTLPLANATDWCGVKSGKNCNKFEATGLTPIACDKVKAPQIAESPISIECKVKSIVNYGTHDMFIAEIVAVDVDDKYIDENGKFWIEKTGLLAYANGNYYTLGRQIGKFGFSVEKKPQKEKNKQAHKFANKALSLFNKDAPKEKAQNGEEKKYGRKMFENRKPKRFSDARKKNYANKNNNHKKSYVDDEFNSETYSKNKAYKFQNRKKNNYASAEEKAPKKKTYNKHAKNFSFK